MVEQFQFRHVTDAELSIILKSLDPNKAMGHDHIPARALRDCASVLATPLTALINTIINSPASLQIGSWLRFRQSLRGMTSLISPTTALCLS